jgi:hypothetical protein
VVAVSILPKATVENNVAVREKVLIIVYDLLIKNLMFVR